ncbi:MAG: T9SS type A sorting domain-containing protein, partial [Bacteroidetes bacterium]|nr:T9SS type A sorting domain-containing protein [Bacteroidota bacterium]
ELFDDGKYQYVVTDHCTLRSFNFFQTYDTLFNQLITNVFRLDAQHILTSGTDGCYLSNDDGMHWERNNTGIGPSEYGYGVNTAGDYLIGNYTFYGTSGNRSVQAFSSDYGKTWRGCVEHPYLYRLIQVKNNYFGVSGPVLFQSRGDITQWNPVYFPELLAYSDPRLAASNDTLLLFADQSDPFQCRMWWTKTSVEPLVFHAINTALPFSPKGYVMHQGVLYITDDFNVWKSGNFGQSWQLVSSPNIGGALYSDNNRLYFIGFQGIKYLTNAGTNWKDIPFPATMAQQLQAVTVTPNALYIMDGNRQIFYQNAGATVWDSLPGFPPNLGPGRVARFGDYLFIPDNFGNIWTNDPDDVGAFEPKDYAEMHIFPNPANELVSIRCNASENGLIQILDLEGALVQRLALQAGVAAFSTKNMVSGMYIVQHTDAFGRKLESQKLIVQH